MSRRQLDRSVFKVDQEPSLHHIEKLILLLVLVPDMIVEQAGHCRGRVRRMGGAPL